MKIVTANGKSSLRLTEAELEDVMLKFEEAKKKKRPGLGKGPCGQGMARGKGGKGGKGGTGPGPGKGDATGPRSKNGTCPKK